MRSLLRPFAAVLVTGGLALLPAERATQAASPPIRLVACAASGQIQIDPPDAATVAAVVGVTPQALQQGLANGQTILQAASGRFASADDLATALLANVKTKLDHAAAAGALTAAQEAAVYAQAHSAYVQLVTTPHPALRTDDVGAPDARKAAGASAVAKAVTVLPDVATVASVVGVTPQALQQDLAAGQTLVQIAGGRFASADDLATALLADAKAKLDHAVAAGALTSAQESAVYAQMHAAYVRLVSTPHPALADTTGPAAQRKAAMASCGKS